MKERDELASQIGLWTFMLTRFLSGAFVSHSGRHWAFTKFQGVFGELHS